MVNHHQKGDISGRSLVVGPTDTRNRRNVNVCR